MPGWSLVAWVRTYQTYLTGEERVHILEHAPSQYNPHIPALLEGSWASAESPADSSSKAPARR